MEKTYFYGTGRRKTSIARVRLIPTTEGNANIIINGVPFEESYHRLEYKRVIQQPLLVTESLSKFNAVIKVEGGGVSGQVGAIAHGIARALVDSDEALKIPLRKHGLLTRDPRVKERKKPGLKRARKAPQYTKR